MGKIILLGRCCRVTFDMIHLNLKEKTSLFEWVWSDTLNEINIIIQKLINNEPIIIKRIDDNNECMEGTNIITSHYINKNYTEIVARRSNRFLNDIMSNDVLFIRDDNMNTIKLEEIEQFYSLIKMINPQTSFKFLLLSDKNTFNEITYPNLYHKVYDKSLYKKYITDICRLNNSIRNVDTRDISDDETSK
jgi:hypothetical protein